MPEHGLYIEELNDQQKSASGSRRSGGVNKGGAFEPGNEPLPLQTSQGREAIQHARDNTGQAKAPRLGTTWEPQGIPHLIASNALESGLNRVQREELARAETFLYQKYIGRLPLTGKTPAFKMNSRTASKLIDTRLSSGEWIKIKEACNVRKGGHFRKLSPVFMLSPAYLEEIAREDMQMGRLSHITASRPPVQRKPSPPEDMNPTTALWLSQGGINWNPLTLLQMLADPGDCFLPEEIKYGWSFSLIPSWRTLARRTASRPLFPRWKLDSIGWLRSKTPNLQGLPCIVRSNILTVDGFPMAEVDYSSCQLNLANHYRGVGIMPDPLTDLQVYLRTLGIPISRDEVKTSLYSFFHGRKKGNFIPLAQSNMGLAEEQAITLWEALLPLKTKNGKTLMEEQGQILLTALDILAGIEARPVLPLYDAIATAEPEKARSAMLEASRLVIGVPLPVKTTPARQRALAL